MAEHPEVEAANAQSQADRDADNAAIAGEILRQLGGRRFVAMTGARAVMRDGSALIFRLPGAGGFCKAGINLVRIELNGQDLYDVKFQKLRRVGGVPTVALVSEAGDVYAEDLRQVFEDHTGLRTSLGTMAG